MPVCSLCACTCVYIKCTLYIFPFTQFSPNSYQTKAHRLSTDQINPSPYQYTPPPPTHPRRKSSCLTRVLRQEKNDLPETTPPTAGEAPLLPRERDRLSPQVFSRQVRSRGDIKSFTFVYIKHFLGLCLYNCCRFQICCLSTYISTVHWSVCLRK